MNLYIYKTPEGQIDHYIDETWDEDYADCQKFHFDIQEKTILEGIEAIMSDREKLQRYIKDYASKRTLIDLAVDVTIGDDCGSAREIKMQATENIREDVIADIVQEYSTTVRLMMEDTAA